MLKRILYFFTIQIFCSMALALNVISEMDQLNGELEQLLLSNSSQVEKKDIIHKMEGLIKSPSYSAMSPSGQRKIKAKFLKAKNISKMSSQLVDCFNGNKDHRSTVSQVVAGLIDDPCGEDVNVSPLANEGLDNLLGIKGIVDGVKRDDFLRQAKMEAIQNSIFAIVKYDYLFSRPLDSNKKYVSDYCKGCSAVEKKQSEDFIKNKILELQAEINSGKRTKYDASTARDELNLRIGSLNKSMTSVYDATDPQKNFRVSRKEIQEKTQRQYDFYSMKYYAFIQDEVGALLLTDSGRKSVGGLREIGTLKSTIRGYQIRGDYHGQYLKECYSKKGIVCEKGTNADVNTMVAEAQKKISQHIQKLNSSEIKGVKDLLKLSPIAVGRALAKDPSMLSEVCEAVSDLSKDDERDIKNKKYIDILTTTLDVISIGAMVFGGAGLLIKGLSTGIRLGLNQVVKQSVKVGVASALVQTGVEYSRAKELSSEFEDLHQSILANSASPDEYERALKLEEQANDAKLGMVMAGASLVPFGAIHKIRKLSFRSSKNLPGDIDAKKVSSFLAELDKPKNSSMMRTLLKAEKNMKPGEFESLLVGLSQMDKAEQALWIKNLSELNFNNPAVRSSLDEMSKAVNACVK